MGMVEVVQYRSILVCVTQQKSCERLIRKAAELLAENGSLYVIHVSKENWNFFDNTRDGEAMEYLFTVSKSYGADLTILHSDRVVETIAQFAQYNNVDVIVVGEAPEGSHNVFASRLEQLLDDSDIKVSVIASDSVKAC
jgi:K+-sensing histidine kinase KdpD